MIHIIDLKFSNTENLIAAFLVDLREELILIETGPYTVFPNLIEGIKSKGFDPGRITKVFISHIHLDHSGGCWALMNLLGDDARVFVHPRGAPHLESPEKLVQSAEMIYGEDMELLWSTVNPIDGDKIRPVEDKETITFANGWQMMAHYTHGHASHHIAWELNWGGESTGGHVFTGDVAGVKIDEGPVVVPLPPPDIDLPEWKNSLKKIQSLLPKEIYLTHFGKIIKEKVAQHLKEVENSLDLNETWFREYISTKEKKHIRQSYETYYLEYLDQFGLNDVAKKRYLLSNPPFMTVLGVIRYLKKFHQLSFDN